MSGQSFQPTPYAVCCPIHGSVFLTKEEYDRQMALGHVSWSCPVMEQERGLCGESAAWDDENWAHYASDGDEFHDDDGKSERREEERDDGPDGNCPGCGGSCARACR